MSETTLTQPVSTLIGDEIITVDPDASLAEVAKVLTEAEIGAVAVGSVADVDGIVSERDLVRAIAEGGDPDVVTAGDLASRQLIWCRDTSSVAEVAEEMFEHFVRHVLVADDDGLAGIVSARDLLGVYAGDDLGFE